uniref:peptidylprolyl isomerase n=1 Tax=Pogona vitticeps TaxID=103695 RepID=A0ABM5GG53_9SAUR
MEGRRNGALAENGGRYPSQRRPNGTLGSEDAVSYHHVGQRMQDITGDGGVLKEIIRAGYGEVVPQDASVLDITLRGMEAGLLTMKKGELARYLFKPSYAFGALGCPPLIPPNATVMFEIELLDFLDSEECDQFFNMSTEQQGTFPLQKVLKVAATEREFGNYLFRQNHFKEAKKRYKRASSVLNHLNAKEDEQVKVDAAKLLIFLNLSFTYLKLECPARALAYGEKALEIDEKNAKALFRCGQACLSLAEYERARDFLVKAQKAQPFNHDINNELKKLASCYGDYMMKEKEMCCRMFSSLRCPSAEEDLKKGREKNPALNSQH